MSFPEVNDTYSPYSNVTQRNFHFYGSTSTADSDNEQEEYTGTPSYSNDESNLEDDISEGMEDSEEEIEEREYNYHNNGTSITTTEDEDDDDEMEVSSSDTESEDTEEERNNNNSNIQQSQAFDNGNNFNMIRNNNGSSNDNNNSNNILPPIQLAPRNPSVSLPTSNINNNNRFIGSDPSPFMDRLLPIHSSRNGSSSARDHRVNNGGFNIPPFPDNFSSPPPPPFRFPNVSHPSPSYPNSTDATVASSLSSTSSLSSSTSNQRKQSPLRFGFPDELQDNDEEEDEDGTSSSTSYDAASSRKRARSISNDWSNVSQVPQSSFPQSIQFGSLEPVNRPSISQNLRSTQLSPSPPPPSNRPTGSRISLLNFSPDNEDAHSAPLSSPSLSHYSPNRIRGFPANSQSSSSTANSSNNHNHPFRSQSQSQTPFFYNRSTFGNNLPRGNYSHTVPQPLELRRPTSTSNHNGNDQQEYNSNFTPASSDVPIVMYPEVIQQPERRHHHHHHHHHSHNSHNNGHISGLSQAHRASTSTTTSTTTTTTTTTTTSRWSRDTRGGRAETLSRHIMPNPNFQRRMNHQRNSNNNNNNPNFGGSMQEAVRVFASDEEPDTTIEVPESSDSEVNVTTSIPASRTPWRPSRRHESRQDNNNTRDSHRSFNSRAALAAIAAARSSTAYEYSNLQSTIDEQQQNVLARLLAGAGRARSATNRRDATSGPSSSSRNESSRRNISARGPVRLPEILSHERHHHEERNNEPRSRGHGSRGGQSRNGGRSSSAGSYLHHFIPHPLWGNLIDSGEIEFEEILDLFPWGNGIAANPDNYLDEDEFDSSYEGLLRLCERIGDAKPKGVSEDFIKTLPTQTYTAGKSKTVEERCTICLTDYEANERLRELPCLHDFHQECIDIWFKNSDKCPICRRSVTEK